MSTEQPDSHLSTYQRPRLHLKPGNSRPSSVAPFPKKPRGPVGHDRQLQDLMDSGETVTLAFNGAPSLDARIIKRCKFTITVMDATGREMILFKHALIGIARAPKKAEV